MEKEYKNISISTNNNIKWGQRTPIKDAINSLFELESLGVTHIQIIPFQDWDDVSSFSFDSTIVRLETEEELQSRLRYENERLEIKETEELALLKRLKEKYEPLK